MNVKGLRAAAFRGALVVVLCLWCLGRSAPAGAAEKVALVGPEAQSWVAPNGTVPGDPSDFVSPCDPLAPIPTPDDGDPGNDNGWVLVDFCSAGATGSGPAQPPGCHHNDDDSAVVELPFSFDLYGDSFGSAFINNNGNLSFGQLFSAFTASGFPVEGFPMIAPFWADVDHTSGLGHVWQKSIDARTFGVTWDNVGYYNQMGDKLNTFQVLISDGTNPAMGLGNNVCFCYDDMQWTTGSASGGVGGFGGTPATVGANRGDGSDFFLIGRFDHAGTDYDGPGGAADGVDHLDERGTGLGAPICFNASGQNVLPIAQGFPPGDEITVACGEALDLTLEFLSPESNQTTFVEYDDPDAAQEAGLSIVPTPGNTATVELDWLPEYADAGQYDLLFTASDDFEPPGVTVKSLRVNVVCVDDTPCSLDLSYDDPSAYGLASDTESGIVSVDLVPSGLSLVALTVDPFTAGASSVSFSVTRTIQGFPGVGTVRARDAAGNTCLANVYLPVVSEPRPGMRPDADRDAARSPGVGAAGERRSIGLRR